LNAHSDDRRNASRQTFRIGRGVKKTNAIDAENSEIIATMVFGFLRGRVRCTTQAPAPDENLEKFILKKTGADILNAVSKKRAHIDICNN
jgi:hypothetical protein